MVKSVNKYGNYPYGMVHIEHFEQFFAEKLCLIIQDYILPCYVKWVTVIPDSCSWCQLKNCLQNQFGHA